MEHSLEIRTVVYRDGDMWAAQCLEFDIGACAPDLKTLRSRFEATLLAELTATAGEGKQPFEGIDPAPTEFVEMWEGC